MKRIAIALVLGAGVVLANAVTAAEDPVASRQAIMKNIGAAMRVLGQMAQGQVEFDATSVQLALRVINAGSHGYGELFPEGSDTGETKAAEAIFTNRDGFWAEVIKLQNATGEALENPPTEQGDLNAVLGSVGAVCSSCHETFRVNAS